MHGSRSLLGCRCGLRRYLSRIPAQGEDPSEEEVHPCHSGNTPKDILGSHHVDMIPIPEVGVLVLRDIRE